MVLADIPSHFETSLVLSIRSSVFSDIFAFSCPLVLKKNETKSNRKVFLIPRVLGFPLIASRMASFVTHSIPGGTGPQLAATVAAVTAYKTENSSIAFSFGGNEQKKRIGMGFQTRASNYFGAATPGRRVLIARPLGCGSRTIKETGLDDLRAGQL